MSIGELYEDMQGILDRISNPRDYQKLAVQVVTSSINPVIRINTDNDSVNFITRGPGKRMTFVELFDRLTESINFNIDRNPDILDNEAVVVDVTEKPITDVRLINYVVQLIAK